MRAMLFFWLVLNMIASVALAEPVTERTSSSARLTESQMDMITAGSRGIFVASSARSGGPGPAFSYAAAAIYGAPGKNVKILSGYRPLAFNYRLHAYPNIVVKVHSVENSIYSFHNFIHFSVNR